MPAAAMAVHPTLHPARPIKEDPMHRPDESPAPRTEPSVLGPGGGAHVPKMPALRPFDSASGHPDRRWGVQHDLSKTSQIPIRPEVGMQRHGGELRAWPQPQPYPHFPGPKQTDASGCVELVLHLLIDRLRQHRRGATFPPR